MVRTVRPSLRRISALDPIEEMSSDSIGSLQSSLVSRRVSVGFSVNLPVNERPQRRYSEAEAINQIVEPIKPRQTDARQSLLEQRRSMVRRASARFRQSLCALPKSRTPSPKRQKKPAKPSTLATNSNDSLPSYARPTAASMAKAKALKRKR